MKARIRYLGTPPGGLVGGFFFYGLYGTTRDEIDFELLSNDLGEEKIFTNIYRDGRFGLPGNVAHIDLPGLVLNAWNEYEIQWFPNEAQWLVNGKLVRQVAQGIPQRDMEARINIWGPDASFPQGYNAVLQPVDSPGNNREYQLQVDHVVVTRLAPDLAVESPLTVERKILTGQPFNITAKVVNAGDAPSSEARLRLFRSQNPSVSPADDPIGTREILGLPPSNTFAADTPVTAPPKAGSYWVIACIDAVTGERTSTNNCSTAQEINVEGPNLPAILSVINFMILDEDETE